MRHAQPQAAPAPVAPPQFLTSGPMAPSLAATPSPNDIELTITSYRYRPRWNNLVIVVLGVALVGFLYWTMQSMPGNKATPKTAAVSAHDHTDHSHAEPATPRSGDASGKVELARSQMMKGHFAKAASMLGAIPAADRDASGASKLMAENDRRRTKFMRLSKDARTHLAAGHWSAAIASFSALEKVAPLTPALKRSRVAARHGLHVDRAYDRATLLARAGKYADALKVARKAQRNYPDPRLVDLIGRIQLAAGGRTATGGKLTTAPPATTTNSGGGTPPSRTSSRGNKPKQPPAANDGGSQNPAPDMGGDGHGDHEHHA